MEPEVSPTRAASVLAVCGPRSLSRSKMRTRSGCARAFKAPESRVRPSSFVIQAKISLQQFFCKDFFATALHSTRPVLRGRWLGSRNDRRFESAAAAVCSPLWAAGLPTDQARTLSASVPSGVRRAAAGDLPDHDGEI